MTATRCVCGSPGGGEAAGTTYTKYCQVPHALAAAAAAGPSSGIDVILMDINMVRLNGDAACAALRASGCSLPIIAVSANVDTSEYVRRFGFTAALGKPFSPEQLREALVTHATGARPGK